MKRKSATTSIHIVLSPAESSAVSNALDFMMHLSGNPFENTKFTYDSANKAAWKVDDSATEYSRTEVRAMSAAIELALHCLRDDPAAVSQVAEDFPDLIPELIESQPTLEYLSDRFRAYVAKLSKR